MKEPQSKLSDSMARQNRKLPQGSNGSAGNPPPSDNSTRGVSKGGKSRKKKSVIFPVLLVLVGGSVLLFAAWSAVNSPVLASILSNSSAPKQIQKEPVQSFAQVDIAKPTYTPMDQQVAQPATAFTVAPETITQPTTTGTPSGDPVILPTDTPYTESPTATLAAQLAVEPNVISAEIIPDTPTSEYVAPPTVAASLASAVTTSNGGEHWIDVNLSEQRLYAYEGDTLVNSFIVSTGTWQTPTVTGQYKIWVKLRSAAMSGPGYYLPDVPFIMYFYKGYGLHGTYWHNNFGTPMSHGCVNLTIPDAEWVYNFTRVGTLVNVHY